LSRYFSIECREGPFTLFSAPHIAAILFIAVACILLYISTNLLKSEKSKQILRRLLALILILQEASFHIWNIFTGQWTLEYALPLQLCGISTILAVVMLVTGSYAIYEVVYFWGLAGAVQAILTPEIGIYTFPHFRYFQFFIGHGAIILSCLFMTFIQGFRPRIVSVWKAIFYLNIYAILVGIFNKITGANYLFICHKPQVASVMDYLGPWPWYIISLEFVAIINFLILYMPFVLSGIIKKGSTKSNYINY